MDIIDNEKPDRSNRVIIAVLVVFALLAGATTYYLAKHMQQFIAKNPQRLELYYKNAKQFTPEQKAVFLKAHAGFWTGSSDTETSGFPLKKDDLLELKDNGIIWEVVEWDCTLPGLPGGVTSKFFQVRTAWVEPYGTLGNDTLANTLIIHQAFIGTPDTCFGAWNYVDLWRVGGVGEELLVNRKSYVPYKGDIRRFFPPGMLTLAGGSGGANNPAFKRSGRTVNGSEIELAVPAGGHDTEAKASAGNMMTLPDCQAMMDLCEKFKKELFARFASMKGDTTGPDGVSSLFNRFFQPIIVHEHFRMYPRPLPREVTVSFTVKANGSFSDIKVVAPKEIDKMLNRELLREIATWRLPPMDSPLFLTHTFTMP